MSPAKEIELSEIISRKATERRGKTFISTPAIQKYMLDQKRAEEAKYGIGEIVEEPLTADSTKPVEQNPVEGVEGDSKENHEENKAVEE